MIALNHNDLKWVFCFSHCALNLPKSFLPDRSSSTLRWLWEWHRLCWQSPTVYPSWWAETEGAHLLRIFRATPSILQEAEPISRQLEMVLSNSMVLANASEGCDPINSWEQLSHMQHSLCTDSLPSWHRESQNFFHVREWSPKHKESHWVHPLISCDGENAVQCLGI